MRARHVTQSAPSRSWSTLVLSVALTTVAGALTGLLISNKKDEGPLSIIQKTSGNESKLALRSKIIVTHSLSSGPDEGRSNPDKVRANRHPLVSFANPEKLESFQQPGLKEAYDIYFSLIGPEKEKYPFENSGFDSADNLTLAAKTISDTNLNMFDESRFEERFLALFHIAQSTRSEAPRIRSDLSYLLIDKVQQSTERGSRIALLNDLQTVGSQVAAENPSFLLNQYHATSDQGVKDTLALILEKSLEDSGHSLAEIESTLTSWNIDRDLELKLLPSSTLQLSKSQQTKDNSL